MMASVLLKRSINGFAYKHAKYTNKNQYHPSLCGAMGCFTWGGASAVFSFAAPFVGPLHIPIRQLQDGGGAAEKRVMRAGPGLRNGLSLHLLEIPLAGSRAPRELAARRPPSRSAAGRCDWWAPLRATSQNNACHCLTRACTGIT